VLHTAYDIATDRCIDRRGQQEYLLIYSFKLQSAFDVCQLLSLLWLNNTFYNSSVWRSESE